MDSSDFCRFNCCNIRGYSGSCCSVGDRDWIMGAIPDHEEVLEKIRALYPGLDVQWDDCFIGYEEGSRLFPEKATWQNPNNFPAMRINLNSYRKGCVFYNDTLNFCQIYDARSVTCSKFKCEHLLENEEKEAKIAKALLLLEEQSNVEETNSEIDEVAVVASEEKE